MEEKKYHHGDLKDELIAKGLQLLAKEGYEGFSMRKLSALCGVSHAAPYKHFKSKEEIVLAVSRRISGEFDAALGGALALYPSDPRMRVIEMCVCYVKFLTENPDYFRFVFMTAHGRPIDISSGDIDMGGRPPLATALACAEAYFKPKNGNGWFADFLGVWSMIHGLTLMLVSGTIRYEGDRDALARGMVERYIGSMK